MMRRDQIREVCREMIDVRPGEASDFVAQSGKGLALAVISLEILEELERVETERDALASLAFRPGTPLWNAFHQAWTAAVGKPGYSKPAWLALETALSAAATAAGLDGGGTGA